MKKVLGLIIVVNLLLSLTFISKVVANQWSPREDWGPQSKPFSPDWGRTVMYEYNDSAYNLYVSPQARFRFTWDAIKTIKEYYEYFYPPLYYTFDISVVDKTCTGEGCNTTVSALNTTMYYSTLPFPHFDRDDDPEETGGNGYYDETEVTCLQPLAMRADTDYRFDSRFKVYSTTPITFEFASQMSFYDYGSGEYNTAPNFNETHLSRNYPWY
ncbi:MAG: hypothetical protein K6343_04070 [Caldisericaceae bacterium]